MCIWKKCEYIQFLNDIPRQNPYDYITEYRRSHGHRHYTPQTLIDVSINDQLPFVQKPYGIRHICTKLDSLYNLWLETTVTNPNSKQCKLTPINSGIASNNLFKLVHIRKIKKKDKRSFIKHSLSSKVSMPSTWAISFIINYFNRKIKSAPIMSYTCYTCTKSIAT